MRYPTFAAAALCLAALSAGCASQNVDVATAIKVGDVTTGWFDAGIVDGKNKLVPCVSFTVTNTSQAKLEALQVFTVFRFAGETEELGSSMVILRGTEALGPADTSKPLTMRATWGFTGEQPRGQMLMHSMFQDAQVEIFVKYRSADFVRISQTPIARQLLTTLPGSATPATPEG